MANRDDEVIHIRRSAAPKTGGASDDSAQFDFTQDTDTAGLETYDEAEAFDSDGSTVADQDDLEHENGIPAPRGELSTRKNSMSADRALPLTAAEKKHARVSVKLAAILLPHANGEAIENQAGLFMKHLPPAALAATMRRVYYDRQGAKIATAAVASKARRAAEEDAVLDEAEEYASLTADDGMAGVGEDDLAEVAQDLDEGGTSGDLDDELELAGVDDALPVDDGSVFDLDGEPALADELPPEASAEDELELEASRQLAAAQRRTPARPGRTIQPPAARRTAAPVVARPAAPPPRRPVTAAVQRRDEVSRLQAVFEKSLGTPSEVDFAATMKLFAN